MRRSTRGLIVLAFALATFITLRFTLGPRWHGHGPCHQSCAMHAEADASTN
ncbi:MAG: hypothetical protein QM724_13845 [Flavobacteriales bacterium]